MKKMLPRLAFLLLCLMTLTLPSNAQDQKDFFKSRIETIDGNEYIGIILEQTSQSVLIHTDQLGEISIPATTIKRISQVGQIKAKNGIYWLDNPQATRYFFAPNAYNLKAGEGYYQNVWVLFNQATVGLTDYFSAGLGLVPLFLYEAGPIPVWVTAKFSVPVVKNKVNLGAGALLSTVIGAEDTDDTSFGILYGIATFGPKNKNLNIGLGWGYADGEIAKNPTLNISAMIRTGAKGYFITENYLIGTPEETLVLTMIGGRRMIKRVGLDFGAVMPFSNDIEGFIALPWLGLTIPFGQASRP